MWAAGIEVNPLLRDRRSAQGQRTAPCKVDRNLQVSGHENVFALGDCAAVPTAASTAARGFYAPTAQNAEREGPGRGGREHPVALLQRPDGPTAPSTTRPIGSLASLGHREAVAQIRGARIAGFPAWLMWRGIYLAKLPRFSRKVQVALDWTGDLFNPAEIAYLPVGSGPSGAHRPPEGPAD